MGALGPAGCRVPAHAGHSKRHQLAWARAPTAATAQPGHGTWSETWAALGGAVRMKNAREGELAACGDWCVLFTMYRSSLPKESGWSHFVSLAETDAAWTHSHSDSFAHTRSQQTVARRNYCQKYCFLFDPRSSGQYCSTFMLQMFIQQPL